MAWKDKSQMPTPDRVAVAIPVRMESKRFPGKPLATARGKPLLWWAWQTAEECTRAAHKLIVTDSAEIERWCKTQSIPCHFDDKFAYATGSDRIAPAISGIRSVHYVVNLQCDEPELTGQDLDRLIEEVELHKFRTAATYAYVEDDPVRFLDANNVKVVCDKNQCALYFSRKPLPGGLVHVGVYAYRLSTLQLFAGAPQSPLEKIERLEQLRLLHHDVAVRVMDLGRRVVSINTPEELEEWNRGN